MALVGRLGHERIEFKGGAVSTELAEAYAALAMTSGGLVILGIRDRDRTVAGCVLSQKIYDRVKTAAHAVGVDVRLKEGRVDGTAIVIVGIPEIRGRIVTTPDGRLLRRIGSDNQPLVGDALQRFVLERSHTSSEEAAIAVFDPDEFDLELINSALEGLDRPTVPRAGVLRALQDLGLAEPTLGPTGAKIFKAALLVFGHDPARRWKGCRVQVVRRVGVGPGPGPSSAREQLSGPLPLLVKQATQFIEAHIGSQEAVVGLHRERVAEYPRAALREAIMNALSHRDYGLDGATIASRSTARARCRAISRRRTCARSTTLGIRASWPR